MDNLVVSEVGVIYGLNFFYVDFDKFDYYCDKEIQFTMRVKSRLYY